MRFDTDRCVKCSSPSRASDDYERWAANHYHESLDFWFCSKNCYNETVAQYLPSKFTKSLFDDTEYKYLQEYESPEKLAKFCKDWHRDEEQAIATARAQLNSRLLAEEKIQRDEKNARADKLLADALQKADDSIRRTKQKDEENRKKEEERIAKERAEEQAFLELIKARTIPEHYRSEHTHILGPSGSGKTTLLQHLILYALYYDQKKPDPPAMVIIDPKGLMVERLQRLDIFNPDTGLLKDRLIVIDPTYEPPPALNMFHAASKWNRMWSEDERRRIENQAIETFGFIFSSTGSALTDKQKTAFSFAVRLMFSMESTILTLVDLMDDPTRTDDTKGGKYSECKFAPFIGRLDPVSQRFFQNDFFSANFRETRQQIKARVYGVLQYPEFVRMFEARERKLDMLDCLQNKSIVLVNTGMNTLGSNASQLLGRYIIALTLNAVFARFTLPKSQWNQAHLIIDEFQEFADDEKTPELLRLAREYKLAVTLAHQEMHGAGMTEKIRSAVSTNTTIKYASNPEGIDIGYVARDMRCEPSFFAHTKKTQHRAQFGCFVRGFTDHPMLQYAPFGTIDLMPKMSSEAHVRLLKANAARLSSPREPPKPPAPTFKRYEPEQPKPPVKAQESPEDKPSPLTSSDW
jgi:energy-coupling factor transporter ATP-binding protein EcfA2